MLYSKQKTRTQILCPWDISTAISPMAGISEKCVQVIVRTSRKSRKIGQHRITKTTQNQLCPNQRSQMTKMRYQNMTINCQRVLRTDVPAVNRFKSRARPRKSHKTMKSSESLQKGRLLIRDIQASLRKSLFRRFHFIFPA